MLTKIFLTSHKLLAGALQHKARYTQLLAAKFNSTRSTLLKVDMSTVFLWPRTVHTGDKVDRIGNKVDRDKLSNSSCCRFVAKTGNKVDRIGNSRLYCRFRQQSTFNKVDRVEFNFVASVYRTGL